MEMVRSKDLKEYTLKGDKLRLVNAIGIFYKQEHTVTADSFDDAWEKFSHICELGYPCTVTCGDETWDYSQTKWAKGDNR
jgi:hypothetical protein